MLHCNWEQRRFLILDVRQHDVGIVVQHLVTFLGRDAIASGSAVREAQAIHADAERRRLIMETLPRAWDELCGEPDALLLRVLADKMEDLSGYRPDDAVLVEYLKGRARVNRTDARLRFADQCQVSGRGHPAGYRPATEDAHTAGPRETAMLANRGKLNCKESIALRILSEELGCWGDSVVAKRGFASKEEAEEAARRLAGWGAST